MKCKGVCLPELSGETGTLEGDIYPVTPSTWSSATWGEGHRNRAEPELGSSLVRVLAAGRVSDCWPNGFCVSSALGEGCVLGHCLRSLNAKSPVLRISLT